MFEIDENYTLKEIVYKSQNIEDEMLIIIKDLEKLNLALEEQNSFLKLRLSYAKSLINLNYGRY